MFDVAEGRAAEREDGRADLRVRDDLDAEDVGQSGSAVVSKRAKYEVLALLVEDQDSGQHVAGVEGRELLGG